MSVYLAYPNRADDATYAGGSWESDLPLNNLKTRYLSQVARSTSAALLDAQLRADFGSDRAVRLASLHNHNLSLTARVRLRGWEDGGTRTGAATYVDDAGIVRTAAIDVTRHFHYIDGVRTTKLQMARTNLLTRSAEFDHSDWTKTDTTPTADNTTAPDGTATADLLTEGTAGTAATFQNYTPGGTSTVVAHSVYAKRGNHDWIRMRLVRTSATAFGEVQAWFNLATGAVGSLTNTDSGVELRHGIKELADGWYRCWMVGSVTDATAYRFSASSASADASTTRVNNATRYQWGAQAEVGAFPTSVIITGAATASRAVDNYQRPFFWSWAEIYAAGGLSFRVEGREGGTRETAGSRLGQIGIGASGNGRVLFIQRGGSAVYNCVLGNGTTNVSLNTTTIPALGDDHVIIPRIGVRDNAGTREARIESIRQWINGVESGSNTTPSAWISIEANITSGWQGSQTAYINSRDANNNVGSGDFILVDAKLGTEGIAFDDPATEHTLLNPYEGGWEDAYPDIYATGDTVDGEVVTSLKPRSEDLGESFTRDWFHLLPATRTLRYWGLEIDDTANADSYVQAGRLVLAPVWEPPHGMAPGAAYQLDDGTKETRIRSGGYAYDPRPGGRVSDFEIRLMGTERAMLLSDLRRRITPGVQFVLIDDQFGVRHRSRNSYLATLVETVPLNAAAALYLNAPFKAREEL